MCCLIASPPVVGDRVETTGVNNPTLVLVAAENADTAAESQYYRPYNNRPSYYNNRRPYYPAYNNRQPTYQQQRPATSGSHLPGACGVTNGVYERWGVCWNYQTQIIEVSKSRLTPDNFGQFYRLMTQSLRVPMYEWVRSVCQAATLMLNNQVVMCAPEDYCMNEQGVAYNQYCYNEICVCLIDGRYAG